VWYVCIAIRLLGVVVRVYCFSAELVLL